MKKFNLAAWIFIAMVLGVITGVCSIGNPEWTTEYLKPIGNIFINLLKFIVCPLVLISIINGMISMKDIRKVGLLGTRTLVYYLITTAVASAIALAVAVAFKSFFPVLDTAGVVFEAKSTSLMSVFVNIFPSNAIEPFLNSSMLQIIVIAILTGIGIILAGQAGETAKAVVESFNAVIIKMMMIIIKGSPIGVFCIMANVVALNGLKILGSLGIVIAVTYIAYLLHFVFVYATMLKCLAKRGPWEVLKGLAPAIIFAFTTTSSVATLPINKECVDRLGADPEYSSFVLPLGATINMDGCAIYLSIATVFIATCYNIQLSFASLVTIVVMATLASVGSAGVPGAALVMLTMVLQSVGLPVEGIALIFGVDKIFDMGRTTLNVVGDAVCTLCLSSKK